MNDPSPRRRKADPRELARLIDDWCERTISSDDALRLNEMLAGDSAARREFLRIVEIHGLLSLGDGELVSTPSPAESGHRAERPRTLRETVDRARRFFARPTPLSLSAATLAVALLITLMAFLAAPFYRSITRQPSDDPAESLEIVARLSRTQGAKWSPLQSQPLNGAFLVAGRRLELADGLAEITYRNGACVILEGPASFVVGDARPLNDDRRFSGAGLGQLQVGTLTAQMNGAPKGQAIATPWGAIMHLGTEFGVNVEASGATEVAVFEGQVELLRSDATGRHRALGRLAAGQSGVVQSDKTFRMTDGHSTTEYVRSEAFNRMHKQRSQVVGLWRFDDADHLGQAADDALPPLAVVGNARFAAEGRYGGALSLDGDGAMLLAVAPVANLPVGNSPYTVAAWIKPSATGERGIVGWGAYGQSGRVNALRLDGANGFKHYWWDNDLVVAGSTVANDGVNLSEGQWRHVAATWDGQTRKFYLQGKLIAQDNPGAPRVVAEQFAIGRTNTARPEYFAGLLDDVAVFRVALGRSAIVALMRGELPQLPAIIERETPSSGGEQSPVHQP